MRPFRASALFLAAIAAVGACRARDRAPSSSDSTATAAGGVGVATPNVVTVHARDYAFDAPNEMPAGMTTFRLVNDGKTLHHMVILRLDSGKTLADLQKAFQHPGPPPGWIVPAGGPNAPDPGSVSNATVEMAPGNYVLMCFIDFPGGVPHFTKGMIHSLTVNPSTTTAPPPKPDVVVTLSDYKFDITGPATVAGKHTFEVRGAPGQPHELELFRLEPGKTADDVVAWIRDMKGPPPVHGVGGVLPAGPGVPVYFTADMAPGRYALFCFLADAKDGKPHFTHGMIHTIEVT